MTKAARYSRIIGTGSYLPEKVLTNADLEKMVDTTDEWIFTRTGIRKRHIIAENQATTDMALIAAQRAIDAAGRRNRWPARPVSCHAGRPASRWWQHAAGCGAGR